MGSPGQMDRWPFFRSSGFPIKVVSSLSLTLLFIANLTFANDTHPGRPNVLFISVDTLRADRVTTIDEKHGITKYIDELAIESIVFDRAFSHVPLTLPSHISMMTGLAPVHHGVHDNAGFRLADNFLTLAEYLKQHGYTTAAFVAAFPLDRRFGLDQGFDTYNEGYPSRNPLKTFFPERPADKVISAAIQWLNHQQNPSHPSPPWFLWIHLFDPHQPYNPPPPYRKRFPDNPYDGEIAFVDEQLHRLFEWLKQSRDWQHTVVVFVGDHGESLGEHGESTHGLFAYNATLHVPFILRIPGFKGPRRVHHPVALSDIFPTLCAVLRLPIPKGLDGRNLKPLWENPHKIPSHPPILIEALAAYLNRGWAPLIGLIWRGHKYIDTPIPELYDLQSDFNETHNLADQRLIKGYRLKLHRLFPLDRISGPMKENPETLETLRSLGYITGGVPPARRHFTRDDDPKVLLPIHEKFMRALQLYGSGDYPGAIELMKEIITRRKKMILAYLYLAQFYRDSGRLRESLLTLQAALRVDPHHLEVLAKLGITQIEMGMFQKGKEILEFLIKSRPDDPDVWNYLGIAYWRLNQPAKSEHAFQRALELDPDDPMIFNNLGNLYFSTKNFKRAESMFQKALKLDPTLAAAYNGIGACKLAEGKTMEAIRWFRKAVNADPNYTHALFNLGSELYKQGHKKEALPYLVKYLELVGSELPPAEYLRISEMIDEARHQP